MGSIRLFALGFFQNNDPVDLTRPTLTRHSPSILPLVPQRTTAQGPWKDAKSLFESRILGRDHHQRDLALPGELDGDLLSGRSKSRNAGGWYGQRLTVPGRRPGQSRRRRLDPRLTRHGLSTSAARKWVMTICLLLVSCAVWVGFIQSEALVIALRCRLDLPGPFRLHSQLYHHRPAPLGRTGRSARVLAPGRQKTSLDESLAFWHHSRSTLQIFPFQGVRPVRGTRLVLNPTTGPVSAPS